MQITQNICIGKYIRNMHAKRDSVG